ncbi:MAG: OmpH family outer membrane protein [Phycisphaeraceae bacterium]
MNTRQWTILVASLTLLVSGLVGGVIAQGQLAARPTSVAVVDLQRVFAASDMRSQLEASINQKREAVQEQAEQRRQSLTALRNELDLFEPGSANHRQRIEQIQEANYEAENWLKWEQGKLQFEGARLIKSLYADAVDAIEDVAMQNGIDVVLFRDNDLQERFETPQQATAQVQLRKIIWASDDVDITDAVINRMNLNFKAR